jgi:hypothetical protein
MDGNQLEGFLETLAPLAGVIGAATGLGAPVALGVTVAKAAAPLVVDAYDALVEAHAASGTGVPLEDWAADLRKEALAKDPNQILAEEGA